MEVVCGIKDLTERRCPIGSGPEMAGNSQLDGGKLEMNGTRLTDDSVVYGRWRVGD